MINRFEIQRKDLPLKRFLTTFETKLVEPEMDKAKIGRAHV